MKKTRLQRAIDKQWLVVALAALLGAFVFVAIYGVQVLVPTNVDWLFVGGDLSQHYIGWEFFRGSAWTFPVGVTKDLAYPHGIAITFMDSIPLLAIPTKLINGILPEQFQYFGWWGLLSFAAIGGLSARIMQRWTKDPFIIIATALFFLASPVVLQRMFMHTALAGHWIILLAIYGLVWGRQWTTRRSVVFWALVLSLSVLIHPYFLAMNVFAMAMALTVRYSSVKHLVIELLLPLIAALFTTWTIGGFTFSTVSGMNFGKAGFDLVAPIAPNGWSLFGGSTYPIHHEAFAYVGLGGIVLACIAAGLVVMRRREAHVIVQRNRWKFLFIGLLFGVLLLFTLGPTIRLAGEVIIDYSDSIPSVVEKVWAVFRVTARVIWPVYYIIMLGAIFIIFRWSKSKVLARVLIIIVCAVQLVDILSSPQLQARHDRFVSVEKVEYVSPLRDPLWNSLANDRKHVVYLGDLYESKFVAIAQFCIDHNLTLNTGYFARKPTLDITLTIDAAKSDLKNGVIASDTMYVYDLPYEAAANLQKREIDGYFVTVK